GRFVSSTWPWRRPLLLLAFLAEDEFAGVFHALALVGLGTAERADLRRDLANLPLVDSGDGDFGRLRRGDRHPGRDRIHDVVLLLEALGDAADEVGDLRARHAPHRAGALVLAVRGDVHGARVDRDRHLVRSGEFEFALGAFDGDRLAVQLRGDAGRDDDGLLADT